MKFLKKTALFILVLLLLLTGVIALITNFYADEVKLIIINNLNKSLKTKVEVAEVDFSIWNSFPLASVEFNQVVIHAVESKNDTLLSAKKLSVSFNLIDLYHKKYRLKGLEIEEGICMMQVDQSGNANYIFWNTEKESKSDNFSTQFEKVKLKGLSYTYIDVPQNVHLSFFINEAELNGNFHQSVFDLNLNSNLSVTKMKMGDMNLFEGRQLSLSIEGLVDQNQSLIAFENTELGIGEMNYNLEGSYHFGEKKQIDLIVMSNDADLAKAIDLMPNHIKKQLERFNIQGDVTLNGNISGEISAIQNPSYHFNFSIENGSFIDKKTKLTLENSFLKGSISNGAASNLSSSTLTLERFETKVNQGKIEGKLSIVNFNSPTYEYYGNIHLSLKDAAELFNWKLLQAVDGNIKSNLSVIGKLKEMGKYSLNDWKNSSIEGEIILEKVSFKHQDFPQNFSEISAQLNFNKHSIEVEELIGKIDESQLSISGKFNNLIGFLLEKDEPLFVDAKLKSPKIDLATLLASNAENNQDSSAYHLKISPLLTVYLETKIDSLVFNKFKLSDLSSDLVIKNKRIDARGIQFKSQEGTFEGDLFVREEENDRISLFSQADLRQVNISTLFKSFNDFGQNTLKSEHISGIADATIRFSSEWSDQLTIDPKSVEVDADLIINNGILLNFKPLESLSKYIELKELKEIHFKTIHNQIAIKNETIFLPRFNIQSSALNLSIAGTHTFDNQIDYKVSLLLNELLGKKVKKPKDSEFGYIEDDGLGRTKLFLSMTGSADDPIIKFDSEQFRKNINEKLSEEKNTFKRILNEEFGFFKKDSLLKEQEVKKKAGSPFQVEYDSSFSRNKTENPKKSPEKEQSAPEDKSKVGKFLDKIAKPNEDEYIKPNE